MSIYKNGLFFGMSVCDISTGDFFSTQIKQSNNFAKLLDEISRYSPAEIVVNEMMFASTEEVNKIRERFECYVSRVENTKFERGSSSRHKYLSVYKKDSEYFVNLNLQIRFLK
jgi:DNA mismatch repair protein MutS